LTFEHEEEARKLGFDKVIMMAGGIGYGKKVQALKDTPSEGDQIVILGGENYRIGMGGAAVSSSDTGEFSSGIELNAIQRSNPEMQKRAANAIRAMVESEINPIVSIHDHGAGGHLNCLSELVEDTGGAIDLDKLPVGDPTLSAKEIIGNESQERMGLVIGRKNIGEHRMRVKGSWQTPVSADACEVGDRGETEDYTANIGELGINDLAIAESDFRVVTLPNNQFEISMVTNYDDGVFLGVYNILGQEVGFEKKVSKINNAYRQNLDMSKMASGVYLLRMGGHTTTSFRTARIIVK
jgi:phosphoribosylformylglycinamidine synthase